MRKLLRLLLVMSFAVLVLSAACGSDDTESDSGQSAAQSAAAAAAGSDVLTVSMVGTPSNYKYVPSDFSLQAGDTVSFKLVGDDEFHTFTVDDLDVDWSLSPKETKTFTFTFDEAGTYKIRCVPHSEMTGTLTVQ